MNNFLLELLVEEIPARFQTTAIKNFSNLIVEEFEKNRIKYDEVRSYITPRRMKSKAQLRNLRKKKKDRKFLLPMKLSKNF